MRNEALLTDESFLASHKIGPSVEHAALAAQLRADAVQLLGRAEADKNEVARAIHDEIGQALTSLSLELSVWKTELDSGRSQSVEDIRAKIALLKDQLGGAIDCARVVSGKLWPRVLDEFGLSAALESQLEKIAKRRGLTCRFSAGSAAQRLKIDPLLAAQIFHLAEEVIEWRAHAGGKSLRMRVLVQDAVLTLIFEDGGAARCLTPEIAARVRLLGGQSQLSGENQSIRISLPLQAQE